MKSISILLSLILIVQSGCASLAGSRELPTFQVDSNTFRRGDWIAVTYTDVKGDLRVVEGRLEQITADEVILKGPPVKRIARDHIARVVPSDRRSSWSQRSKFRTISPKTIIVVGGLMMLISLIAFTRVRFDYSSRQSMPEDKQDTSQVMPEGKNEESLQ